MTTEHSEEKPLDRFYALYEDGRDKGAPQSFIDYFVAAKFLLDEIDAAKAEARREMADEILREVGQKRYVQLGKDPRNKDTIQYISLSDLQTIIKKRTI